MPGFDPATAQPVNSGFDPSSAQLVGGGFDPTSARLVPAAPQPAPGATGWGMVPQLISDIFNPHAGQEHLPNALEQPLVSGPVQQAAQGLRADYMNMVTNGLFMQPTRAAMETMGIGRQPGESDASLHARYSAAVQAARQQAAQQVAATRATGSSIGDRLAEGAQWLGQQGAGIAANPEYFLIPGAGGSGVVGRVARAGAMGAGIGGLSDAAAQIMDQMEGDKKNFDITQNLQQVAGGAIAGAGLHTALGEIPSFVKNLFAQRGMDTLPPDDPRAMAGNVTPLTQQKLTLRPADHQRYLGLLANGSVDDIHDFFRDRNGPQPSYQDINAWVEHRDGAINDPSSLNPEMARPLFSGPDIEGHRSQVEQHIQALTSHWQNAPEINVVHGPEDIQDPVIRQQAMAADAQDPIRGFVDGDGKVHVFSGRVDSPEMANAVTYHEGLGHFGLAQKFGDNLDAVLNTLMDRNVNQFSRDVDKWQAENPGAYGGDRTRAAEEVLAEQSENGQMKPTIRGALDGVIRRFGTRMGLKMSYSDAEIRNILAMAHDAVVNGKGVAENGFRTGDNKFMFVGRNSVKYDPFHPTDDMMSDGRMRNEISDQQASLKPGWEQANRLGDVLDHPTLFDYYPQLRDLPVTHSQTEGLSGYYDTDPLNHININPNSFHDPMDVVLHETQHAIQHIEQYPDFMRAMANGGTAASSDYDYANHPSENEARAVESRRFLTDQEREQNPAKFMRVNRGQAASPDYEAQNLDRIYEQLDKDYQPSTMSWEDTKNAALKAGFKPSQVRGMKETEAGDLSVRLHRMQAAANMADQRLSDLDAKLGTPDWTEKDQADYLKTVADFQYLAARVLGERAEIARALNVSKMAASYGKENLQAIADRMAEAGSGVGGLTDPDNFLKFARQLQQLRAQNNPAGVQKMLQNVGVPGWEDYLTSFHMNAMLSGLSTHFKAPQDMATGIGREMIERAIAVPIGKLMQPFWGKGVTPQEVAANWYGVVRAITDLDLYRRSMEAVKNGQGQWVQPNGTTSPTHVTMATNAKNLPRIPIVSIPTDLISGQDTYFRGVSLSQNLYSIGMRQAMAELGPKAPLTDTMALAQTYAMKPTPAMLKEAQTLTNRTLLLSPNRFNDMITSTRAKMGNDFAGRLGKFVLDNIAPFIRVASNSIFERVWNRSPLGLLNLLDPKSEIRMGGPRAGIALAKIAYGTALIGMYWMAADKGMNLVKSMTGNGNKELTGEGPDNIDQYKEKIASGWRPNSVYENGRYNTPSLAASINPFDIHNTTATTVADLREAWEAGANKGQVATALKLTLGALIHQLTNSSWINDLTQYGNAIMAHGQTSGETVNQLAGSQAGSWVPNGLGQAARMLDPTQKLTTDPNSMSQSIENNVESRIPGLTGNVPTKYSVYGDPLANSTSLTGVHTIIPGLPGNGVRRTTDPAELELDRLNSNLAGLREKDDTSWPTSLVTPVSKTFKIDQEDVPAARQRGLQVDDYGKVTLTPAQFEQYQQRAGHYIVEDVRQEMSTPEWQNMSDHDKVLLIRDIVTDQKYNARQELFDGNQ